MTEADHGHCHRCMRRVNETELTFALHRRHVLVLVGANGVARLLAHGLGDGIKAGRKVQRARGTMSELSPG